MKRIVLLLLIALLLAACQSSQSVQPMVTATNPPTATITLTNTRPPTKTPTLTPTVSNTPTTTPTPTPIQWPTITPSGELTAHTWAANPVLVYISTWGGDGGGFPDSPNFVLYSDGKLFTRRIGMRQGPIYSAQLTRQEICAVLNTIDQVGFFEFDPDNYNYESSMSLGSGIEGIRVNSWKSKSIEAPELLGILENKSDTAFNPSESMIIAQNTFMALYNYAPESRQPYLPEDIELWLFPAWNDPENAKTWPDDLPTLSELYEAAEPVEYFHEFKMRRLRLNDTVGAQISQMAQGLPHEDEYTDGVTALRIIVNALLPYPYPDPDPWASFSPNLYINNTPPATTLTCQPSDGSLAIPSP